MSTGNESFIQRSFADRIGGSGFGKDTAIYKFEKIKRAKRRALRENPGRELIDLGVGEPDEMAFPGVVETLSNEARKPENRGYADNGIPEFKAAAAKYLLEVFGVQDIKPETEVVHSIGSKPALAMFPSAFINPGDITIMTVPGYPVMGTHTKWLGGEVYNLPLLEGRDFLPVFDKIPEETRKRAKLLYLNYPNNPTGAAATVPFFREVVQFARENNVIVVHDAAYAALNFNDGKPLSFLSIPGAKDVGVEIHSLSKAYNMTGWRLAFVSGNPLVVSAFANIKDNFDSGQFIAIQKAGIHALNHSAITERIKEKYERRLRALVSELNQAGLHTSMPGGSFYLYVKVPARVDGREFSSGEEFSEFLITEKLISTVPWDDAGAFIRFSATFEAENREDETRIIRETGQRLKELKFEF